MWGRGTDHPFVHIYELLMTNRKRYAIDESSMSVWEVLYCNLNARRKKPGVTIVGNGMSFAPKLDVQIQGAS